MKGISLTILITIFIAFNGYTQVEKVEFELEKTPFKISLNTGVYRSRFDLPVDANVNSFQNFSIFAQVYFPFKRSLDKPENFKKPKTDLNYFDRLFTTSPVAVFHVTEKGGNALGLGQELSFKIAKKTFVKSQLAVAWVESSSQKNDGLKSGINFHHFWHFSTYINANTHISIGYNNISNGKIFSKEVGSLFDMLVLGISYSFQDRI